MLQPKRDCAVAGTENPAASPMAAAVLRKQFRATRQVTRFKIELPVFRGVCAIIFIFAPILPHRGLLRHSVSRILCFLLVTDRMTQVPCAQSISPRRHQEGLARYRANPERSREIVA